MTRRSGSKEKTDVASTRALRGRLLRDLAVLASVLFGAVLAVTLTLGWRVTNRISASLIENATRVAQKDIDLFFQSVEKNVHIARKWGQAGLLDLGDAPSLNVRFVPVLEEMPAIGGIVIARTDGAGYYLRRDGDDWLTWRVLPRPATHTAGMWQRWSDAGTPVASWEDTSAYDPRERPWFRGALSCRSPEEVFWTGPYPFFSLDVPGVTVSAAWQRPEPEETHTVIGFDVMLNDIVDLVSGLRPTPNGAAFLFTEAGSVFTKGGETAVDGKVPATSSYLTPAHETGRPALAAAVERWKREGGSGDTPVQYAVRGNLWWAGFRPLTAEGRGLWLGVIVPEEDLLGEGRRSRTLAAVVLLLLLAAGIAAAVLVVRAYGRHLQELAQRPLNRDDMEPSMLRLIEQGEGDALEFKSTMRTNLKTGKPEKGIELAWLKTVAAFLNTGGGRLLFGVDDQGTIQGTDADGFASDDKCRLHFQHLIAEHIGIEHSGSIHMDVHTVRGRTIVLVECQRSEKPVFLSHGKEESFYIRSGPSSVKLPVSKALQYVASRK